MQMTWGENVGMALGAVWSHKFRSFLTILGIVIGITTVVTVSSLLTGLRKGVVTFFEELGPDNIFVFKTTGDPNNPYPPPKEAKRRPIKPEYADAIRRFCPSVEDVGVALFIPNVSPSGKAITAHVPGAESDNVGLSGNSANMFEISPQDLAEGRVFTAEEDHRAAKVAVIGFKLAEALFPEGHAVGKSMMVDGAEYTIVGVNAKAKGGFFGENGIDRSISIPLRTAQLRYPQVDRYMLTAHAFAGKRESAFEEVQGILRKLRHVPAGQADDFSLSTPDQIIKQFDSITRLIFLLSIAISGLGLLVGGIGVMNIMLVSVTERTREIGVRKAIGARRFDIISQFLMEAMALTGAGGVVGLVFATMVTMLIGALVPSLPSETPIWAVVTGFSVSVLVGVFFGVWPAMKAASLDPVEALRYE